MTRGKSKVFKQVVWLFLFALPLLASSQDSKLGNWLIYFGNKKFDSKWNLHHEVQYRNYDAIGDLEQLLLRTGLGYSFSGSNIMLGYGYIWAENYNENKVKSTVIEHRIFQQFSTGQEIGSVKLTHRYRFEQRFVEADFNLRLRYFLSVNIPIKTDGPWYFSAYNEIFLNTTPEVFDRNRLYSGLGYKFNEALRLEIGYMNQFLENGNRDQINFMTFFTF